MNQRNKQTVSESLGMNTYDMYHKNMIMSSTNNNDLIMYFVSNLK
jgi:hypothetical protein